jgi:hypothetical protein
VVDVLLRRTKLKEFMMTFNQFYALKVGDKVRAIGNPIGNWTNDVLDLMYNSVLEVERIDLDFVEIGVMRLKPEWDWELWFEPTALERVK